MNWMRKMAQYTREENVQDSQALFGMFAAIQKYGVGMAVVYLLSLAPAVYLPRTH